MTDTAMHTLFSSEPIVNKQQQTQFMVLDLKEVRKMLSTMFFSFE